jgi:hypothetical protein
MNKCKTFKLVLVHATKTFEWAGVEFHCFLTLALGGVEWSTSSPKPFTLGERSPVPIEE